MNKPIILIGGGGHCKAVIEAAESSGREIKGILDLPATIGSTCLGYPVIGSDDDIPQYANDHEFIVTLGFIDNPALRYKLHQLVDKARGKFTTIIASTAHISRFATIEQGTVVLHEATVNAGAHIGRGCIINTQANIEHDVRIADYCHISTGAMVNGDCKIGERSFIGSGSVICNGVMICPDCIIGAGSVITKDIMESGTYAGVPVKRI